MAMSTSSSSDASSVVIDERRAQQLMERAMGLAERGDTSSAILACRQAISLVPHSSQSYSMLGLLLERSGDVAGAITAYEKVLDLAPDSLLERESLGRLRATAMPRRDQRTNSLYDQEDEERTEDLPTAPGLTGSLLPDTAEADGASQAILDAAVTRTVSDAFSPPSPDFDFTPVDETARISTTEAQSAASDAIMAAAKSHEVPNASAQPPAVAASTVAMPFPSTAPKSAPSIFDPGAPLLPPKEVPLTTGQKLRQRPSFYFRSLPLSGAASVSVLFLLWAHAVAPTRVANEVVSDIPPQVVVEDLPPEPRPDTPARPNPAPGTRATAPTATVQVAPPPTVAAAPTSPATTTVQAPVTPVQPAAGQPAPPVAEQPRAVPPRSTTPAVVSPAAVPETTTGTSPGGAPVNPAGTSDRSYVQVGPSGRSPVARPENNAAADEQAAGNDARSGRADSALERLSRSIDSGGSDVAFRLQQRAQMYMQNGDGARAVADFQAAINAYEAMISRGDRVSIARSGIQACRRGMQLAVSRR
jgi:hypothetical protein